MKCIPTGDAKAPVMRRPADSFLPNANLPPQYPQLVNARVTTDDLAVEKKDAADSKDKDKDKAQDELPVVAMSFLKKLNMRTMPSLAEMFKGSNPAGHAFTDMKVGR